MKQGREEQNFARIQNLIAFEIDENGNNAAHTNLIIQLAQAEQLQGIRKALEGILSELKKQKPVFNSFLEGLNKKADDRSMPDLSKTPTA